MNVLYSLIIVTLSFISLFGNDKKYICITIPKTGTHLVINYFKELGLINPLTNNSPNILFNEKMRFLNKKSSKGYYKGNYDIESVDPIPKNLKKWLHSSYKKGLRWSHFPYTKEFSALISKKTKNNFLTIRDPRDQVVSMAFMLYKHSSGKSVPFDTLLLDLIDGKKRNFVPWGVEIHSIYPLAWELGIVGFYGLYLPWLKNKDFYLIRFENLVGPQGGGTEELQLQEMKNIAKHLGIDFSDISYKKMSNNIFGGTWTFREGSIGSWKKYFTPEITAAFKATKGACQLLIDLGYETDTTWKAL